MRFGTLWRFAVLASLALLVSGQLCMLTTCVPRLVPVHASHACCRALPLGPAADGSQGDAPSSESAMPCGQAMHTTGAPSLAPPLAASVAFTAFDATAELLAPPARVIVPRAPIESHPPLDRTSPAPAGLRAPPQA